MVSLDIRSLSVGYGSKAVLRDVSLELPAGCCVLLAGANGSGKSTLLKTLGGLLPPLGGEVAAEGSVIFVPTGIPKVKGFTVRDFVNTSFYAYSRRAANVGCVPNVCRAPESSFGHSSSSDGTAFSSAATPAERDMKSCVQGCDPVFLSAGRHPYPASLPPSQSVDASFSSTGVKNGSTLEDCMGMALEMLGIEAFVDRDISTLSDGEFQKACVATAVARVLAGSGRGVLLLDEPAAYLDVDGRASLAAMLQDLAHRLGVTVIYSSHDIYGPSSAADRIMAITPDGRLLFSDSSDTSKRSALSAAFASYRG